jgi:hypothetical protein
MSALAFWPTVLFGWVVISIVSGLVVGRILHRVLALPNRVPERRVEALRLGRTVGGDVSSPRPRRYRLSSSPQHPDEHGPKDPVLLAVDQ